MQRSDESMSANPATSTTSSFPRRRKSLLLFPLMKAQSNSRLRGNDDSLLPFVTEPKSSRASSALQSLAMLAMLLVSSLAFAQASDPTPLQFKDATQELTERLDRISHFAKELDHDLDQITARMAKIIEYEKDRYMP